MRAAAALLFGGAAAQPAYHLPLSLKPDEFRTSKGELIDTYQGNFTFEQVSEKRVQHPDYPEKIVTESSFKSPPMKLKTGGTWFSLPTVSHLPMPAPKDASGNKVPFAIIKMVYDMQDDTGRSVPVSEVYLHHWLMYDEWVGGSGDNLGCGGSDTWVSNIYGAGDEMRNIAYHYPKGYAQIQAPAHQHWSGNLHFIRTEDLVPGSLKKCAECTYQKGKAPSCKPGLESYDSFVCCMSSARCPVNNPDDNSTKTYYLTYTLEWTTDINGIIPVHVKVIDALNCAVTHSVGPNQQKVTKGTVCGPTLCESTETRKIDESGTIFWGYTHIHIGAANSSLYVNGVHVCDSIPQMGTQQGVPGNEKGFLIGFSMCLDKAGGRPSVHVNKGDELKVVARINVDPNDNRSMPLIAGGEHRGQMALFYFYMTYDNAPPATSPPGPPAPAAKYACTNGVCVAAASGIDLPTCKLAC